MKIYSFNVKDKETELIIEAKKEELKKKGISFSFYIRNLILEDIYKNKTK